MIRELLASAARNESLGPVISRTPIARDVLTRLVGGETIGEVLRVAADLADRGFLVSIERAPGSASVPEELVEEQCALVDAVAEAGLARVAEVAVRPEAFGGAQDHALLELARQAAARDVALMLGNGPGTDARDIVRLHGTLANEGLTVGLTLPAALRDAEELCARTSGRVRLVKGGRGGRAPLYFSQPIEIDKSFVRCAKALVRSPAEPSFATHDSRLIDIVESLALKAGRPDSSYEFTMFMGRQESEQDRLLEEGRQVRVYVPYGPEWFERLVGGLAEQPSTIAAAVRSLLPGS